jgi:ComF family protein
MAEAMRGLEPLTDGVCLIPIPLGRRRLVERGYNQSERLASALARHVGGVVRAELLVRERETATQTALTPEARRANVAGAFRGASGVPAQVVLVDDVFTTGATLCAAAAALRAAGAGRVQAVTFARAAEMA